MPANTPHARLLKDAAKNHLVPLGLAQLNRSRIWIDDHDWWLVLVEFQADDSRRGSYLNVGVMWLWRPREEFSFDVGYRLEDFKPFRNKAQFEREAEHLVARAGQQVEKYRKAFATIEKVAAFLMERANAKNPWTLFHAGVACGLAHRTADATRCLGSFVEEAQRAQWDGGIDAEAADLCRYAETPGMFRVTVEQAVIAGRAALRLDPSKAGLFDPAN